MRDRVGVDVDERRRHAHALVELDDRDQLRHLVGERRRGRPGAATVNVYTVPAPVDLVSTRARSDRQRGQRGTRVVAPTRRSRRTAAARRARRASASQNGCDTGVGTGRGLGDRRSAATSRSLQHERGLLAHHAAGARSRRRCRGARSWRSPARPWIWRTASTTCDMPAGAARSGRTRAGRRGCCSGKSPRYERSCSCTKAMPSPLPQKPESSMVSSAVIV